MSEDTAIVAEPRQARKPARGRAEEAGELLHLAPDRITASPDNPRQVFDGAAFDELVRSIERHGLLQPLVVRWNPDGGFELLCGERRLRAARKLGLATVPCVRLEVREDRKLEVMLIENLHREDLDPIATARAYRALIAEHGHTQEALAERLARSRPAIANALRLLDLPDALQALVASGALSAGHARAIVALDTPAAQEALARRVIDQGLSVRETEMAAQAAKARGADGPKRRRGRRKERAAWFGMLEERMRKAIGASVAIEPTGGTKGRIVIDFQDDDEFERLLEFFS